MLMPSYMVSILLDSGLDLCSNGCMGWGQTPPPNGPGVETAPRGDRSPLSVFFYRACSGERPVLGVVQPHCAFLPEPTDRPTDGVPLLDQTGLTL